MLQVKSITESVEEIQPGIFLLKVNSPEIAQHCTPGQFCNLLVHESGFPLLRRPFSICDIQNDSVYFMFNIVGQGTEILSSKKTGDQIDIIGPLGNGFNFYGDFEEAIIIAGGIGSAPFPFLIKALGGEKRVTCFVGGRNKIDIITYGMTKVIISTDDGSLGFKGNVVQLLESKLDNYEEEKIRIFGCGPNPMLRALSDFTMNHNIDCQISTESVMACGFGICQGCPIEKKDDGNFILVCKDGPVFKAEDVII